MYAAIVMAGPDEGGVFLAGQWLARAGQAEGRHVTWLPAADLEARAGTAHCAVILADQPITSAGVDAPTAVLVSNIPALEHYAPRVQAGGVLIVDSTVVEKLAGRPDIREIDLPATALATGLGVPTAASVVLLGALLRATGVVRQATLVQVLTEQLQTRPRPVVAAYIQALHQGAASVGLPVFGYGAGDAAAGLAHF